MECDNTTGLKGKNESQEQHAASSRIECLYLIAITVIGRFVCYCIGKADTHISEAYCTQLSGTHTDIH